MLKKQENIGDIYNYITTQEDEKYDNIINDEIPKISIFLKSFVRIFGDLTSWLVLVLMMSIVIQVVSRYVFDVNFIALEELQWHLYAIGVIIGLSYAMVNHSHVRVDIFRINFSEKLKRKFEIFGILFLMFPFIFIVINHGFDFASESFRVAERSDASEGLPYRWIIKAFIPIGFTLLFFVATARLIWYIKYLLLGKINGN